jgi:hypothetical protein
MRQLLFVSLSLATLALAGVAYALQAGNYRNVPGPVTGSYEAGIKATFRLTSVSPPEGIPSPPSGGACIIFPAKDLGFGEMSKKHCSSDSDCSTPNENPFGYCEQQTKKCWSRPTAAEADPYLCRRGVTGPVGEDLEISAEPAPIFRPEWNISKHAKARVLTCLNGLPPGGCAGNGNPYVYEWGTPKQL